MDSLVPFIIQSSVGSFAVMDQREITAVKGVVDCEFLHPTLCKNSVKKRVCLDKQCKYPHLRGTARKPKPKDNPKKSAKTSAKQISTKSGPKNSKGDNGFLELKTLVQNMTLQFQQELAAMKSWMGYQQNFPLLTNNRLVTQAIPSNNGLGITQPAAPPGFTPRPYC